MITENPTWITEGSFTKADFIALGKHRVTIVIIRQYTTDTYQFRINVDGALVCLFAETSETITHKRLSPQRVALKKLAHSMVVAGHSRESIYTESFWRLLRPVP